VARSHDVGYVDEVGGKRNWRSENKNGDTGYLED
jgi:hypothetical protein